MLLKQLVINTDSTETVFDKLPDDVIEEFREISNKILEDLAKEDETIAKVYESYTDFKSNVSAYHEISEDAFIESRNK